MEVRQHAIFSACGKYRHLLVRVWNGSGPILPYILLNPSTAGRDQEDGTQTEDATSRKARGFAVRMGYGGYVIANIYDFCATKPSDLRAAGYPRSAENIDYIERACAMGDGIVVCGWGANARGLKWPVVALTNIRQWGYKAMALRVLKDGVPEHPLMIPYICADTLVEL